MSEEYIGILQDYDSLYSFLVEVILGQLLGVYLHQPVFDVYRLNSDTTNWSLFHYIERQASVDLVCKFYGNKWLNGDKFGDFEFRAKLMHREFDNLRYVRSLGFDTLPHQVVRPLAFNKAVNCVLVEDFAPGLDLEFFIYEAIRYGKKNQLYDRLADLAWFLADLHCTTQLDRVVNESEPLTDLEERIGQLAHDQIISREQQKRLSGLCDHWAKALILGAGSQVLLHGDPRPHHFFFAPEGSVTAVDLEDMRSGDRASDIGHVIAGLKHRFLWHGGNLSTSQPYVNHLYAVYASHLPAGVEHWGELVARSRFYAGYYLVRYGQIPWLDPRHRHQLIEAAEDYLRL